MRRPTSDWLLLPLFALPLLLGIGFCLWVRADHAAQLRPYLLDGSGEAQRWVEQLPDQGAGIRERFLHGTDILAISTGVAANFRLGHRFGVILGNENDVDGEWTLATDFPGGLAATALANANVRLKIESGSPIGQLEGADAPTAAFARLLKQPDLSALRTTQLPASSKLFLVERWLRDAPDNGNYQRAARTLRFLRAFERAQARIGSGWGAHTEQTVRVFLRGAENSAVILPRHANHDAVLSDFEIARPDRDNVRLRWSEHGPITSDEKDGVLWSGRLEQPLTGTWSLVLPDGDGWWRAPTFARWAPLVLVCMVLLTVIPLALLINLRKQRKLDAERARFLNELAHDLRTPLTSLRLYAEMLATSEPTPEKRARYTDVIARESSRLSELLANLLDLSRLEHGRRQFEIEELSLARTVDAAIRDFKALHPKRAGDVEFSGPADVKVHGDRAALARCLANLLDNAGKFTAPGDRVSVAWTAHAGQVRIVVADEGPGIPPAERDHVFGRYHRGQRAKSDGVPGTGLGLSLVRELMQGMGGDVVLEDAARGTRFLLTLPGDIA